MTTFLCESHGFVQRNKKQLKMKDSVDIQKTNIFILDKIKETNCVKELEDMNTYEREMKRKEKNPPISVIIHILLTSHLTKHSLLVNLLLFLALGSLAPGHCRYIPFFGVVSLPIAVNIHRILG